jgi:hypothetical protein
MATVAVEKKWWEPIWAGFRWVTFIPGGFIAGMLACIVATIFIGGNMWLFGERFDTPFSRLFGAGMLGYIAVHASALIAPIPWPSYPVGTYRRASARALVFGWAPHAAAVLEAGQKKDFRADFQSHPSPDSTPAAACFQYTAICVLIFQTRQNTSPG